MKKSKYISKYDYIAYYTKPKAFWFYTNTEIESSLETIYRKLSKNNKDILYDDWDEDSINEADDEKDSYQFYLEKKEELKNIDLNNPQIAEGIIIDKESKKFIIETYNNSFDYKIVDFDDEIYKYKKMEELAEITKDIILNNKNVIIFQGVFIDKNTITKPDALIKSNNNIIVIETKGTSTAKKHHFLDLFYQKNVIENQKYLIELDCIFDYKLCLVKYEILNKYQISFSITDYINYTKVYSDNSIVQKSPFKLELKAFSKLGYHVVKSSTPREPNGDDGIPIRLKAVLNHNLIDFDERICNARSNKKDIEASQEDFLKVLNEYDQVIETLWKHKLSMKETDYIKEIHPNSNDKSRFKNFDYFPEERKIYSLMGYNRLSYSGNIAYQDSTSLDKAKINENPLDFLKESKDQKCSYKEIFTSSDLIKVDYEKTQKLLDQLKTKKVYFDFETINTAIRSIDKSLPFAQIITQCSIIKDLGQNVINAGCNNMIIDPTKINDKWLMDIVDNIYAGNEIKYSKKDNEYIVDGDNNNEISYVVYNKTFERSRLKEIDLKLNNKEYTIKIEHIINNLYDIADFFTISAKRGYYIFIKELKGFYSIKKVLPLISKYAPDIFNLTNCLNYNDLEISNGRICQEKTIQRFFKSINDEEWLQLEDKLKTYCENDVRAMIAVEYFIKDILNNKIDFSKE
ncbi:DUF2779 domain-containing protein [Malacoplasma muris]|uniref:DUF2779 domain-containing protein n=1 Tax=Malacoplasma muris TaxID=2119 RepID=UPI00398E8E26